jgi:hypothetical protein
MIYGLQNGDKGGDNNAEFIHGTTITSVHLIVGLRGQLGTQPIHRTRVLFCVPFVGSRDCEQGDAADLT